MIHPFSALHQKRHKKKLIFNINLSHSGVQLVPFFFVSNMEQFFFFFNLILPVGCHPNETFLVEWFVLFGEDLLIEVRYLFERKSIIWFRRTDDKLSLILFYFFFFCDQNPERKLKSLKSNWILIRIQEESQTMSQWRMKRGRPIKNYECLCACTYV